LGATRDHISLPITLIVIDPIDTVSEKISVGSGSSTKLNGWRCAAVVAVLLGQGFEFALRQLKAVPSFTSAFFVLVVKLVERGLTGRKFIPPSFTLQQFQ
jgi:hypothetical protein